MVYDTRKPGNRTKRYRNCTLRIARFHETGICNYQTTGENTTWFFGEKHGLLAVGEDVIECFDAIDTMAKSAQIYLDARTAGFEPVGMTDKQLDELAVAFNLPLE